MHAGELPTSNGAMEQKGGAMANQLSGYEQPYEYYGDRSPSERAGKKEAEQATEPKKAVALAYDPKDHAPQVVATGKGAIADRIIEKAKENDVPTYVDKGLADTLMNLDVGDYIPPELYGVVAEILVYVDRMDKLRSKLDK